MRKKGSKIGIARVNHTLILIDYCCMTLQKVTFATPRTMMRGTCYML